MNGKEGTGKEKSCFGAQGNGKATSGRRWNKCVGHMMASLSGLASNCSSPSLSPPESASPCERSLPNNGHITKHPKMALLRAVFLPFGESIQNMKPSCDHNALGASLPYRSLSTTSCSCFGEREMHRQIVTQNVS